MQAVQKIPVMMPQQLRSDELSDTDELKWDFLRELVEVEFAKIHNLPPQSNTAGKGPLHMQAAETLSGASTAFNSPSARPVQGFPNGTAMSPIAGPMAHDGAISSITARPSPEMTPLEGDPVVMAAPNMPRLIEKRKEIAVLCSVSVAATGPQTKSRFSVFAEDYAMEQTMVYM